MRSGSIQIALAHLMEKIQPPDHLGSTFHDYKSLLLCGINGCCRCKLETCLCEWLGARAGVQMACSLKAQTFTEPWMEAFLTFLHQNPPPNLNTVMPHMFVGDEAFSLWLDLQKPFSQSWIMTRQSITITSQELGRSLKMLLAFWQIGFGCSEPPSAWIHIRW